MTAEVTVMNRQAIALAADSAVTIRRGEQEKVINTANKLFRLSSTQPVGIMVYGNASLLTVPWETIIKLYRTVKSDKTYDTLNEYSECFLDFIVDSGYDFFPVETQERYVASIASSLVNEIVTIMQNKIQMEIENEKKKLSDREIKIIASDVIEQYYKVINNFDSAGNKITKVDITRNYIKIIDEIIDQSFERFPLLSSDRKGIVNSVAAYFTKDHFSDALSGIVFAGFGDKEFFPSLCAFKIDAIINNKVRYSDDGKANVSVDSSAHIRRFAQGDMVYTFIEGIDPNQKQVIDDYIHELLSSYPKIVIDKIADTLDFGDKQKEQILKQVQGSSEELMKHFLYNLNRHRELEHVEPIINLVSTLPKEELAVMAETLVNLTSFKQKMTIGIETVGGPIDVAVITKGDGFTWVKRKGFLTNSIN